MLGKAIFLIHAQKEGTFDVLPPGGVLNLCVRSTPLQDLREMFERIIRVERNRRQEIREKKRNRANRSRLLRQAMVAEVLFFNGHQTQ